MCTDDRAMTAEEVIRQKAAVVFDLFHTLTAIESTCGKDLPFTCDVAFTRHKLSNEKRLAPFLVGPIRYCRGETLVLAVETAGEMGDPVLLPVLIEDALASEYVRPERLADKEDYKRVWMATARAIYRLAEGAVGIERPDPAEFSEEGAKEALAQWRTWWEANRADALRELR